ncbi:hypothetical protein [Clostridium thermobutyricum]|uniref:hypothetical protein n=1 Tax=Clostridium thermobutyricum TaxID=29372 RepID=UPI0029422E98|nr:hypothetical protein [Clostridium thermobutyricum]
MVKNKKIKTFVLECKCIWINLATILLLFYAFGFSYTLLNIIFLASLILSIVIGVPLTLLNEKRYKNKRKEIEEKIKENKEITVKDIERLCEYADEIIY